MASMMKTKEGRKKVMITVDLKKEIIKKHERGTRVSDLAKIYSRSTSTICSILKKKEEIKALRVAKGVFAVSKQRPRVLDEVESVLLLWINEKQLAGERISEGIICEKARMLYEELLARDPGTSGDAGKDGFKASRGWFENFKKRTGLDGAVQHVKEAEAFVTGFKLLVDSEGYSPQQVFNCDETGLFWKKMPKRTFITAEEKALPGHKPMKDRLTLLLCANASGDFKVKPLLVYHSENPRAFKKNKVQKNMLNVMWRSNNKAWVTRVLFVEWINEVFGPEVKKYLLENDLPFKALLLVDNSPSHPTAIEDDLLEEFKFIKLMFLPANITPILQPMDQQVISSFKKLYTKAMFQRCFEVTDGTDLTLREFWKEHFTIVSCLQLIGKAWEGVTKRTLNSAWKNLWPDCVPEPDFVGFEPVQQEAVDEEIVTLGESMGLEVNMDDLNDLLDEHSEQLTTRELLELHAEQLRENTEDTSSVEESGETEIPVPTTEIRDILKKWDNVKGFVEKYHPDKALVRRAANLFTENAVSHFHNVLKKRQKQRSAERVVVKVERKDGEKERKKRNRVSRKRKMSDSVCNGEREIIVKREILAEDLMGGDSPSKL